MLGQEVAEWSEPDAKEAQRILHRIEEKVADLAFAVSDRLVAHLRLPYYRTYTLCRVTNLSMVHPAYLYAYVGAEDAVIVDGTPLSTYKVNIKAPIVLSPETVGLYVLWFFRFWRHTEVQIVSPSDPLRW